MKNILHIGDKCTGCTACMNICPKAAIHMVEDKAGFTYPSIDADVCVDCGKCASVCPEAVAHNSAETRLNAYYGAMTDEQTVKISSSGGAFSLMAQCVLEEKGLVCGAVFNYNTMDLLYSSTDICNLDELRRSKYIASQPREIFNEIKNQVDTGRIVLFCGLPCHIHGLIRFLGKDYDNLITCDFICGGTASPKFFKEHLHSLEQKYKGKVTNVNFRAKLNGWKEHSIKINFDNNKEYRSLAFYDSFFKGYFEKAYQRKSCYNCQYRISHKSDIIIADYWDGLRKGRGNDSGVSMVITNSEKGDTFFNKVLTQGGHNFTQMPINDSDYVFKTETERYNKALVTRAAFMELYEKHGFEKAARKTYFNGILQAKIKRKIYKIIRKGT